MGKGGEWGCSSWIFELLILYSEVALTKVTRFFFGEQSGFPSAEVAVCFGPLLGGSVKKAGRGRRRASRGLLHQHVFSNVIARPGHTKKT